MSTENWKIEKNLCRCCHTEGEFKSLGLPYLNDGLEEVYSDMLRECFDLSIMIVPSPLCLVTYAICETCILRLRDAKNFKRQVIECEEKFKDMCSRDVIIGPESIYDADVKAEPDAYSEEFKEEYSNDDDDDFVLKFSSEDSDKNDVSVKMESKKVKRKSQANEKGKISKSKSCRRVGRPRKVKDESVQHKQAEDKQEKTLQRTNRQAKYYTITQDKQYSCNECAKMYASQPLVSQHYRFVHLKQRPRERKCPKCDVRIPGYLRAYHLEEAHGIPAPTCGVCGRKFRFPCHVLQHQKKVHMGERTVACDVCGKSFFSNISLRLHMSTHSSEKKYKCNVCAREFRWENNLRDHVRIHIGDKRYVCSVCKKGFIQKSTLKQHVIRNHPGVDMFK